MGTKVSQQSVIFNIIPIFRYTWNKQHYTNGYKEAKKFWILQFDSELRIKKLLLIGVISFTPINLLLNLGSDDKCLIFKGVCGSHKDCNQQLWRLNSFTWPRSICEMSNSCTRLATLPCQRGARLTKRENRFQSPFDEHHEQKAFAIRYRYLKGNLALRSILDTRYCSRQYSWLFCLDRVSNIWHIRDENKGKEWYRD